MKGMGLANYVWMDQPIGMFSSISKLDRKHCRMLVGLLMESISLQYMLHKMADSLMQEMRCRKGNVGMAGINRLFRLIDESIYKNFLK